MSHAETGLEGRRAQAKRRTRNDIVAASLELFQRRGFPART
jgi:AcrR family transcriptional regulator